MLSCASWPCPNGSAAVARGTASLPVGGTDASCLRDSCPSADPMGERPEMPDGNGGGPTLNPGGSGQLLFGAYDDVRGNNGVQINNFQILNQNTNDPARVDCTVEDFMAGVDGDQC